MHFRSFLFALLCLSGTTLLATAQDKLKPSPEGIAFFEKKIRPVLVKQCYRCHSVESSKSQGGLLVDSRQGLRKGGDSGPAIMPGEPENSLLMKAILYKDDLEMPPNKQLPEEVIADFRQWIKIGAPDPRGGQVVQKPQVTPATDLWCLQPIRADEAPTTNNKTWAETDIDRFILARLEKEGLAPVGDAQPLALLRRIHFDLTGLPPTPDTIRAFSENSSPAAFAKIVDQLLQSPQFGERWGRHWLDVARYADSNGKDRDALFPHAWRYRNYVIDAFNADKPFDQFVREQIAGDLLKADDAKDREENLIATGFLAVGSKPLTQRGEQLEMDIVDDQIDTTSRAFLGLTVSCARCHDHKFDPIPTKNYYSMASIFRSTKTFYGGRTKAPANLLPLPGEDKGAAEETIDPKVQQRRQQVQARLKQAQAKLNQVKKLKGPERQKQLPEAQQEVQRLQRVLDQLPSGSSESKRFAMAVQDEAKPRDLRVLVRGEVGKQGEPAPRGFLSAVSVEGDIKIDEKQSGRLQLAEWIAEESNPLTARVLVNRVWHHLFGRGLVRTMDNFGSNGEKPSHPELLDSLAHRFMTEGWSVKKLIREIVLSRVYQLDTTYDAKAYEIDPDNTLLWRRALRRLDVEAIRDSMLQAGGELILKQPERSIVAEIGYGEVGRGINTKPLERPFPHRSVYLPILRTQLPEVLKVFDFAEPSLVVGQRSITTIPAQALYLMNSPFVIERAGALADRLLKEKAMSAENRIEIAYLRALGRFPEAEETQRAETFLSQALEKVEANDAEKQRLAWTSLCQALFASAEFRYIN